MTRTFFCALALCLFVGSAAAQRTVAAADPARDMEVAKQMEILLSVYRNANLFYVDSTKPDKLTQDAVNGMLKQLDPYTEYIPAKEMDEFEFQVTGKYGGIGSLIRQRGLDSTAWVEIAEPYEGTPAAAAGLRAGDRLIEIDGVNLQGLGSQKVSAMLKGDPDTKFTLKYRPIADTTTTKTIELVRKKIAVPSVPYYGLLDGSVGYLRLTSFTEGCAGEVRSAVHKLRELDPKLSGLVLDLRGNGGGSVGEAIDILGMFLPRGTEALKIKGRVSSMGATYTTRTDPSERNLPLVVLVNSLSASSAEIVAGALQDLDRAVVLGQRSFGKGLVQSPQQIPYNGLLKITTAKYYTPSGRCIQALDYTHRREDGSVGSIPDSIIKAYKTKAGRTVYDGGGIMPDVRLEPEYLSKFAAILTAYGFIDDFANRYAAKNPTAPAERFVVSDKLYDEFVKFMADKEITYESMSSRKLKELKEVAEREKYGEKIAAELEAISKKIKDDKNEELQLFRGELKELLAEEIVRRWGFERAAIAYTLVADKEAAEAVKILKDKALYEKILKEQDTVKN